ncbi:MAG TPA: nuclear transport factor 2 family protein [Lacunisphaera sp.]|nr:nuclear transport factor 2 family protein [Lacunisphaera sp.]
MKNPTLPRLLLPLILLASAGAARASDDSIVAAVRAADDERVAATLAPEAGRLDAIFSDDLLYTHSTGKLDTKKSYVATLLSKATVYTVYDYKERTFFVATPDIVIEKAHVLITSGTVEKQNPPNDLMIQAVWRKESGKWRFLSWQSARLPAPTPAPATK